MTEKQKHETQAEITPQMTVIDVIYKHRNTELVFKAYDTAAGACICCSSLFDTIEEVSENYGIDLAELMRFLRRAR